MTNQPTPLSYQDGLPLPIITDRQAEDTQLRLSFWHWFKDEEHRPVEAINKPHVSAVMIWMETTPEGQHALEVLYRRIHSS
jgi:hypothetical protein